MVPLACLLVPTVVAVLEVRLTSASELRRLSDFFGAHLDFLLSSPVITLPSSSVLPSCGPSCIHAKDAFPEVPFDFRGDLSILLGLFVVVGSMLDSCPASRMGGELPSKGDVRS